MELKEILDRVKHSFNNSAEKLRKNTIPYTNGRLQTLLPKMRYTFHVS